MSAEVRVLGPIEIIAGGRIITLRGRHQHELIAVLSCGVGRIIPNTRLIEALWDDHTPTNAKNKLHAHICALRKEFGGGHYWPVVTHTAGYLLSTDNVRIDLAEYQDLLAQARAELNSERFRQAAMLLTSALRLWRGPALAGTRSRVTAAMAEALEQTRLLAVERKAACDMLMGHNGDAAEDLAIALAFQPQRESLRALLMLALYRRGCRADALRVYRSGRELLRDAAGLEPSSQLRDLHQTLLAEDPILDGATALRLATGNNGAWHYPVAG